VFKERIITISGYCPDKAGIVAKVSQTIFQENGWILDTSHHSDIDTNKYFMRIEIKANSLKNGVGEFLQKFTKVSSELEFEWQWTDSDRKKRVALLVSKEVHCLFEILARNYSRDWNIEIPLIISNHRQLEEVVNWHQIPFYYLPMKSEQEKRSAFIQIDKLIDENQIEVIILARFMQIIPSWLCDKYPNRIINIHHSFLPSFVGAKPYHQAFGRGVKLIGATCHYVTEKLDQGPIIEQDVIRIDHSDTPEDLIRCGREIEKIVLSRGLQYHLEDRVIINGIKTVVFR